MFLVSSSLLAWHYIPLKEYFQIYYAKHLETDTISSQICGGQCQPVISEEYMLSRWGWFGFVIKNICAPILYGFPSRKCISSASSSPASQPGKLLSSFTSLAALNSAVGQEGFECSFELHSVFFSTVSDGQGKGSGVSKDLRLSKYLLSSLLVIPLGIPGFIRGRKRKVCTSLCSALQIL